MDIHIPEEYGVDQEKLIAVNKRLKLMKKFMKIKRTRLETAFSSGIGPSHTLCVSVEMCRNETTLYFDITDYNKW